jgi:hypothetical protein
VALGDNPWDESMNPTEETVNPKTVSGKTTPTAITILIEGRPSCTQHLSPEGPIPWTIPYVLKRALVKIA